VNGGRALLLSLLIVLLILLQYRLWVGDGGIGEVRRLRQGIEAQVSENTSLKQRNRLLGAEVMDLKSGLQAVEERARSELGMIKEGETFFQVIEPAPPGQQD
jgi:cell division protein FtsB